MFETSPEELLKQGQLSAALSELKRLVRDNPADPKLRIFLFQLMSILGDYDKALTQLKLVGEMDSTALMMVQTYKMVLQCEPLRQEVFAGRRTPLVLGEPEPWIGQMMQALSLQAEGRAKAAGDLRSEALEFAPVSRGAINGQSFEWLSDMDTRLGPILEVVANGKYYWAPFHRIKKIIIEAPTDLRDLIWIPAQFIWSTDGQTVGLIPVRYPGSDRSEDPLVMLSRKTEWTQVTDDMFVGLGQRTLMTNTEDYPLLEVREVIIEFH